MGGRAAFGGGLSGRSSDVWSIVVGVYSVRRSYGSDRDGDTEYAKRMETYHWQECACINSEEISLKAGCFSVYHPLTFLDPVSRQLPRRSQVVGAQTLLSAPSTMNQSPASRTPATTASSSNFNAIFDKALEAYTKKTKQDLTANSLVAQVQECNSPDAIVAILQDQIYQFRQSQSGDERLQKWLSPTINVLYAFSATLGQGVGLVNSNRSLWVSLKYLFCRFSLLPKLLLLAPASSSR